MRERQRLPDPQDVLAGRRPARLHEMFQLVHAVNPTERGLRGAELAAAYALKARLQSLLIERFGDELVLEEVRGGAESSESGEGAIVGLRHRSRGSAGRGRARGGASAARPVAGGARRAEPLPPPGGA